MRPQQAGKTTFRASPASNLVPTSEAAPDLMGRRWPEMYVQMMRVSG